MSNSLRHSPADIVRQVLIDVGLGTDPDLVPLQAWPVYVGSEPTMPDDCITVYNTAGVVDGRSMPDGEILEHRGWQVRVRALDNPTGYQKMDDIRTYMSEVAVQVVTTIASIRYLVFCFAKFGDILDLGKDVPTSKRSLFTLNGLCPIRQLP
jgi:hypothetical protein